MRRRRLVSRKLVRLCARRSGSPTRRSRGAASGGKDAELARDAAIVSPPPAAVLCSSRGRAVCRPLRACARAARPPARRRDARALVCTSSFGGRERRSGSLTEYAQLPLETARPPSLAARRLPAVAGVRTRREYTSARRRAARVLGGRHEPLRRARANGGRADGVHAAVARTRPPSRSRTIAHARGARARRARLPRRGALPSAGPSRAAARRRRARRRR